MMSRYFTCNFEGKGIPSFRMQVIRVSSKERIKKVKAKGRMLCSRIVQLGLKLLMHPFGGSDLCVIYITFIMEQEEVYFPIREINLSQPKNPSNGTEFRILSFKPPILSLYVWDHISKEKA